MGKPLDIVLAVVDGVLAVTAMAIAYENYLRRPLGKVERFLYIVTCFAFFVPGWASRIAGLVLLGLLVAYNYRTLPSPAQKSLPERAVES